MNNLAIGLFDSGVGGLTVMKEIATLLPNEDLIYLGDTARLPYGNKSSEAVSRFALDNAQFLLEKQIKLLVVSCHTACSHALDALQKTLPIPVVGVTQSGFEGLVQSTQTKKVAVLGTASTIGSGLFQGLLSAYDPSIEVFPIACPLFVSLVEEGFLTHEATRLIAEHYLSPLKQKNIDSVLLACTHYPLLSPVIQQVLGPTVQLIIPAQRTALETQSVLLAKNWLKSKACLPKYQFYASDDPDKFRKLAKLFFPSSIETVHLRTI
ncbi:MAG TPA: glutamate racemase [Chlamydiales bacterium]|jgi:glutamate racemase